MAQETYKSALNDSITAAAALTAKRFIGFDGNHCGANAKARGVSMFGTDSGEECALIALGYAIVTAGGAIAAAGTKVASDANGKAVTHSTGEANGFSCGPASGDGVDVLVKLI